MPDETSTAQVMEFLLNHMAPRLPPEGLADVLDRLTWCLDDEGAELLRIRDEWLQSDDLKRVAVALAMEETLPFDGGARMRAELGRIATRWPELAGRCTRILQDAEASRAGKQGG